MIMWIAIFIIILLMILDKDESKKIKEQGNQIVGYNTNNGRPILRKHVNITGYDTRTGQAQFEYKKSVIGYHPETGDPIFEGEEIPAPIKPKQPMTEEEKTRLSNTILMIAGAILIVIASIIFLATGWETMHGLLKTFILFGIQMIFCLFAYISNNKLNIPKIGKMFNYLTLSFVPIILLSLSFFNLVGDYFSIDCEGFNYYIGLSLLASDFIYKIYGKIKKDIFLKRSSLVLEIIAILFLVVQIDIEYIGLFSLIIHTIILYILLQGGFLDKKAYQGLNDFYSIMLVAFAALFTIDIISVMIFTNLALLAMNFFIRCLNETEDYKKKPLLSLFFISYLLALRIIENIEITHYFLYLLSLLPILGLTKVVNTENMKKNIVRVVGILTIVITSIAAFNAEQSIYYLLTYIIGFIVSIMIYNMSKKSFYKLWAYISFSAIFFVICYITEIEGVSEYILLVISILIYALEVLFDKLKDKVSNIFIVGCLCLETLVLYDTYYSLIPLSLMVIYFLLEKRTKDIIIPMIYSFVLFALKETTTSFVIIGIVTAIFTVLSVVHKEFNKYTMFSLIYIFLFGLYIDTSAYVLWGCILAWGIIHYLIKTSKNNGIYSTAIIIGLFGLYTKALIDVETIFFAHYALGICLVSISMTKGVFKKANDILMGVIECFMIGGITLIGAIIISDPLDGVLLLAILLVISIWSYIKNWKFYMTSSVISMIFGVIVLTAEYWKEIPWYVYILFIGMALIIFAMYDEKRKQNKRLKEQQNFVPQPPIAPVSIQPENNSQVVTERVENVADNSNNVITNIHDLDNLETNNEQLSEETDNTSVEEETIIAEKVIMIAEEQLNEEIIQDNSNPLSNEQNSPKKNNQKKINKTAAKKTNKTNSVHKNQSKN